MTSSGEVVIPLLLLPTQWYIPASDRRADTIMRVPLSRSIALSSSTTAPLWYQVMVGGGWPVITHCSMTVEPFMTASSEMEICTNSGPSSHEEEEEEEVKSSSRAHGGCYGGQVPSQVTQ